MNSIFYFRLLLVMQWPEEIREHHWISSQRIISFLLSRPLERPQLIMAFLLSVKFYIFNRFLSWSAIPVCLVLGKTFMYISKFFINWDLITLYESFDQPGTYVSCDAIHRVRLFLVLFVQKKNDHSLDRISTVVFIWQHKTHFSMSSNSRNISMYLKKNGFSL